MGGGRSQGERITAGGDCRKVKHRRSLIRAGRALKRFARLTRQLRMDFGAQEDVRLAEDEKSSLKQRQVCPQVLLGTGMGASGGGERNCTMLPFPRSPFADAVSCSVNTVGWSSAQLGRLLPLILAWDSEARHKVPDHSLL